MLHELPETADEMFCFATYQAAHVINRAYLPLLRPLGLTYPQYIALTLLWEEDGQSVGGLSRRLRMDSNTLTPLLKRMEKAGHVTRQRGTRDERQVFVHLTEQGRALRRHAPEITSCMVQATGLNVSELQDLITTLNRLSDAIARPMPGDQSP